MDDDRRDSGANQRQPTAAARAYRRLERMIVTLVLEPGSTTTEAALMAETAIGRTPLREALQRLSWEGLVEVRPRAGVAISVLHAADWIRVIEARRGLERVIARSAARFATSEVREALNHAAGRMRAAREAGDFLEADKDVDEAMARAAANNFAIRCVAPLQIHSRRFWFRYQDGKQLARSSALHAALADAVCAGDEERAEAASGRLMSMLDGLARSVARH